LSAPQPSTGGVPLPATLQQALLLQQRGQFPEAERLYRALLARERNHFAALYGLAILRARLGDREAAVKLMRRALNQNPRVAGAHNDLGNMLEALGRYDEAIERYERALSLDPGLAAAHTNLGRALNARGRPAEAMAHHERALALAPELADAHNNLGVVLQALGRAQEASAHIERAIAIEPGFAEAHNNLGNVLRALERHEAAIPHYLRAIALRPSYAEAHHNLANALQALQRYEEAIPCYEQALALRPTYAEALNNLGNALQALNRHEQAVERYEQALVAKPNYAEALNNLGNALAALNRHEAAIPHFARAQALQPENVTARFNEGLARLVIGDFAGGLPLYESRFGSVQRQRDFAAPQWRGEEPLAGRTILLHAEQGLGDTLQFARYLPMAAARGARVVLEVQRSLVPLLAALPGVAEIVAQGETLPAFDCHSPLMSLPLAFGTSFATIPTSVPYLVTPPERVARWHTAIEATPRPRVGVVWAGNPANTFDRRRTMPLERLRPLLEMPGATFFALQKDLRPGDAALLAEMPQVTALGERLEDFADTAAVVSELDLVITICTSMAHLAGGLARPMWVMLPFSADFRWFRDRPDSVWYPTARLFRQPAIGDWESVVAQVKAALGAFIRGEAERA
jgi:tetratricopeptide (TPR) repeat protein